MFSARTFDKQLMDSASHALEVHHYLGGNMGVMKGCDVTENVDGNLEISAGAFIVMGRQIEVISTEVITVPVVPSGTLYSILIFEIDLSQTNTETEFLQGSFKIVSDAADYPTLTQEDLTDGGTTYQFLFARFENTVTGIGSLSEANKLSLNMGQYATKENPEFTGTQPKSNGQELIINSTQSSTDILKVAGVTEAEYTALTKDANTLYVVI